MFVGVRPPSSKCSVRVCQHSILLDGYICKYIHIYVCITDSNKDVRKDMHTCMTYINVNMYVDKWQHCAVVGDFNCSPPPGRV